MKREIKDELQECIDLLDMAGGKLRWARNELDQDFLSQDESFQEGEEGQACETEIYDICECIEQVEGMIGTIEELCGY